MIRYYLFYVVYCFIVVMDGVDLSHLPSGQNGRHFADDSFKCIFVNEKCWISIQISVKFVPRGTINNNPALV